MLPIYWKPKRRQAPDSGMPARAEENRVKSCIRCDEISHPPYPALLLESSSLVCYPSPNKHTVSKRLGNFSLRKLNNTREKKRPINTESWDIHQGKNTNKLPSIKAHILTSPASAHTVPINCHASLFSTSRQSRIIKSNILRKHPTGEKIRQDDKSRMEGQSV